MCIALPPTFDDSSSVSTEPEEEDPGGEGGARTASDNYVSVKGSVLVEGQEQRGISVNEIAVAKRRLSKCSKCSLIVYLFWSKPLPMEFMPLSSFSIILGGGGGLHFGRL